MDIEVNYKNKKRYRTGRTPWHQNKFWTGLIWVLSKMMLLGKERKVEWVNSEPLKPPYMMLSNHMHFIDFELAAMATFPHSVSNVVNIDGYINKFFLLEWIGAISTRKFTNDVPLVKSIRKVLQRGDILAMYPEARYSPCGVTSYLPDSLGKLIRMNKVPVVAVVHHGNHLYAPVWNVAHKRKVPLHTTFKVILTPEQIETMSVEQINKVLREELQYDDYRYQKENGIRITEEYRAEGLEKVLYQCPHCMTEFSIEAKGAELHCTHCDKRWVWEETGELRALEGETEFDHIPDWFAWERQQVKKQIEEGTYSFEDEVEVYSLPRVYRYIPLGKAKLTHDPENGFMLKGHYRGEDYYIHRQPQQSNSLHVEYAFTPIDGKDYVDISTENDSFYCRVSGNNVITKLAFATEDIYLRSMAEKKKITV